MKITGIILLIIGLLSLFGGFVSPSDFDISVVIVGYIIKAGLIIGGIALISKANRKQEKKVVSKSLAENDSEDANQIPEHQTNISLEKQKDILLDAKLKGVFTEEEYRIKLQIINLKEKQIQEAEDEEHIMNQILKALKPDIDNLEHLMKANLISKEEFQNKRAKLINDKRVSSQKMRFETIEFNTLKGYQQRTIRDWCLEPKNFNVFLIKGAKMFALTYREFEDLKVNNENSKGYYYVNLPEGFDPHKIK